jgi:hypothetical protein
MTPAVGPLFLLVSLGAGSTLPAGATAPTARPAVGASSTAKPGASADAPKPVAGPTGAKPAPGPAAVARPTTGATTPVAGSASAPSAAGMAASLGSPIESQHRRELEDIQRQDVAMSLARRNIMLDWREHKLAELIDWRDRVEVATLLATNQNLDLDWRTMSLSDLNDIRLRAAKSSELAASYGVTIDWRLYSWKQLEELRRAVAKIQASEVPNTAEGRARKKAAATVHAKSTVPAVPGTTRPDKQAILEL